MLLVLFYLSWWVVISAPIFQMTVEFLAGSLWIFSHGWSPPVGEHYCPCMSVSRAWQQSEPGRATQPMLCHHIQHHHHPPPPPEEPAHIPYTHTTRPGQTWVSSGPAFLGQLCVLGVIVLTITPGHHQSSRRWPRWCSEVVSVVAEHEVFGTRTYVGALWKLTYFIIAPIRTPSISIFRVLYRCLYPF